MTQEERLIYLINLLKLENPAYSDLSIPESTEEQKCLLRALMNVREAGAVSEDFLRIQDEYLQNEIEHKGVVDSSELQARVVLPGGQKLCLWQGDITLLKCDAIVNAANSAMTGCYVPNHACIDNCIHTFAGVQLRYECGRIMTAQKIEEPAGRAKITGAYNLPCKYVLHTVGPIVSGSLTKKDENLLESCYKSCLSLASENKIESIAFCCISTGVFHFPNGRAAEIAIAAVKDFFADATKSTVNKVIFNVFKDEDKNIYERLLK